MLPMLMRLSEAETKELEHEDPDEVQHERHEVGDQHRVVLALIEPLDVRWQGEERIPSVDELSAPSLADVRA